MNIAMVVYSHYSRDARVRRYAEALAKKGMRVDVICLKENYLPKDKNISLIQYPLPRRRFGKLWYILEYLLFFLYTSIILSSNYFNKRYKVVHIHNMPDILIFTAIIPKLFSTKIILDMHDPMPELYMSKYNSSGNALMVKLLKLQEKVCFSFADEIITANPEFKKIFLSRNPQLTDKISVILNCPDPNIFNPITNGQLPRLASGRAMTNDKFILLYMGTVEKRFGLDIAIEAIPRLIKKIPNLRFIIIPKLEEEGTYIENLEFRIKIYELSKYIQILNPLPLEKISEKIRETVVGVVLAKNGIFTESIFPVKLLEFLQMNIPVIATKTKILSKYFDDKMIYFLKKNSSEEFAQAVLDLWKNKKLRVNLATNAGKYLKEYNWPKEKQKYLQLINKLTFQ